MFVRTAQCWWSKLKKNELRISSCTSRLKGGMNEMMQWVVNRRGNLEKKCINKATE